MFFDYGEGAWLIENLGGEVLHFDILGREVN